MTDIAGDARVRIAQFLPHALEKALRSYQIFQEESEHHASSKDFKAHHDASKTAIAHIELLLKLVEKLDLFDVSNNDTAHAALAEMIQSARGEVDRYNGCEI